MTSIVTRFHQALNIEFRPVLVFCLLLFTLPVFAQEEPKWAEDFLERGRAHRESGRFEPALKDLNRALQLKPADASIWLERARCFRDLQQLEKALSDCRKAGELAPKRSETRQLEGLILSQLGRHREALMAVSQSVRMDPANADYIRSRYLICFRMGRQDIAHTAGETYIGLHGWDDAQAPEMAIWNALSLSWSDQQRQSQAILHEALNYLPAGRWPRPVVEHLAGAVTSSELLDAAGTSTGRLQLAYCVMGMKARLEDQSEESVKALQWVADNGTPDSLEWHLSRHFLGRSEGVVESEGAEK